MKHRKLLAVLMALLMLVSSMSSCSDETENSGDPADNTVTEHNTDNSAEGTESQTPAETERLYPDVPESADFGGDEIKFLFWGNEGWKGTVRYCRDVYSEGLTGEPINDTVYARNVKIEEAYKVKIALEVTDAGSLVSRVDADVASGDTTNDVVYPVMRSAAPLYTNGSLHNLNSIKYIDLEKPWWDQNCKDAMECAGYLPGIATSINLLDKDATSGVAFNKDIAKDNQLEDIYALVRDGKWTLDKVAELSEKVNEDTNGDGQMSPDDDVYGFLGANDVMDAFWHGSGSLLVKNDSDDGFIFTFGSERDIDAAIDVVEFMNQPWFMNQHIVIANDLKYRQAFETGHGLFYWMRLDDVSNMRAADIDFGVLPTPKYEESQDTYYNLVSQHTSAILSVPITQTGEALEELGLILEALAAESHYTLIPEYIEESLMRKNARDEESADMIKLIIENRIFDPMNIYGFGDFANTFLALGKDNNTNIASVLESNKNAVEQSIQDTVATMIANADN